MPKKDGTMTKRESEQLDKRIAELHNVFYKFTDYIGKKYHKTEQYCSSVRKLKNGKHKYYYKNHEVADFDSVIGYEAMELISNIIKKLPSIKEVRVDDDVHANSRLYLIPHETKTEYWGTTVMFVPQCTKTQNMFFLYPENLDNLISELKQIQKRQKADKKYQKIKRIQRKLKRLEK